MLHFNQVKKIIIDFLIQYPNKENNFFVIRDVFGRITIYVEGCDDKVKFEEAVKEKIGVEWFSTIEVIQSHSLLYKKIIEMTNLIEKSKNVFYGERPLAKKTWLRKKGSKLKLNAKVITFYSYKGGVGRTSALVLTALQMVRQGKKVVVIDMDLEAPGVATLLKPDADEYPQYGTSDYLIEISNSNSDNIDIDEYIYPVTDKKLTGMLGGELYVFQATDISSNQPLDYFDKISRVDLGTPQYDEDVNGVTKMLSDIDGRYKPDYIFIDSRAGIHDIGGLTLTQYSDNAVLVFYGNKQNMFGLKFVLDKLVEEEIVFSIVNSPMPFSEEEGEEELDFFISNSYNFLCENGYYKENEIPDKYDENADHYPINIKYNIEASVMNNVNRIDNLLNNDGKNNCYFKLAEQLKVNEENNYIDQKEISKNTIREAIKDIILVNTAAAENEFKTINDLTNRFYPLKEYKFIFDNNKFLVVGPKGSGKTALFSVLAQPDYAKELAKYLDIPMKYISTVNWITGLGLGNEFPSKDNFNNIGKINDINYFRVYWQCMLMKVLKEYIIEYIQEIPSQISTLFSIKYSGYMEFINSTSNIGEIISDVLGELDSKLSKENKIVIVTYDTLDFALNFQYRGKMIGALINLWFENVSRLNNIKAKIFLRDDIFKFEVKEGITDKVKIKNYTADLHWQYDYLLAMIWKRVVQNNNEVAKVFSEVLNNKGFALPNHEGVIGYVPIPNPEINKILLKEIIGEKMGKGNKAYTYNWILYRLADTRDNIMPRSILKLFSIAGAKEIELSKEINDGNFGVIRPRALENSIEEVSEDRLADLSEEYTNYKSFFEGLKNYCPNSPINEENFYDALVRCGIQSGEIKTSIEELKVMGVLKEYQRKKSDPIRYHVADIYLRGMGLSRKGYR